jgi:hypothetical protein
MPTPSPEIIAVLQCFAPVFTKPTLAHACTLVYGALLTSGARTVASALRAVGLAHCRQFTTYHRVLNRARWSPLALSRRLLALLVATFLPAGAPLVLLVDETLERRRGSQIAWKSRFRDPLRASPGRPVTTPALRWLNVSLLVPMPWSQRPWALPFLTLPAPAPATSAKLGKRHRTLVGLAALALRLVRRWQPDRALTLVGDGGYAAIALGHACRHRPGTVRLVSRLRLDAVLHAPPAPRQPGQRGPTPKKGARLPQLAAHLVDPTTAWQRVTLPWYGGHTQVLDLISGTALWYHPGQVPLPIRWVLLRDPAGKEAPTALFSTDQAALPEQVVGWFVGRWNIEVTFEEARTHLGLETQRQWTTRAIGRTTPCLLGLVSLVTVLAYRLHGAALPVRQAAWYPKREATFSDALAAVRRALWGRPQSTMSSVAPDELHFPGPWWDCLSDAAAYAA